MDNYSVACFELSDNDVQSLAQIVVCKLEYYKKHTSPFQKDYVHYLRTVVGLGFTAALASERDCLCKRYLDIFVSNDICNEGSFLYIANAIAKIIQIALVSFRSLDVPQYFESFAQAAKKILNTVVLYEEHYDQEAKRLLGIITANNHALY